MADFSVKWKKVLERIDPEKYRSEQFNDNAWRGLPTRNLPREAQTDIDRSKKSISSDSVLVLNHPYCGYIDLNGSRFTQETRKDNYLKNLERLLLEKDPEKADTVFFDYPELYVFDSRERMIRGQIQSVVLTNIDGGGSLFHGMAYREIGRGKTVFLAGSYPPCVSTTASEIHGNGNRIAIIEDALLDFGSGSAAIEEIRTLSGFRRSSLKSITTEDFLKIYGKTERSKK